MPVIPSKNIQPMRSHDEVENSLRNKSMIERAEIKAIEISKVDFMGERINEKRGIRVQIIEVKPMKGGVEVLAKAWKNGKQLGFGEDGTVEIERFKIYNPPVLVSDPNGTIVREWLDRATDIVKERRLRYDPEQAIIDVVTRNISIVGKYSDVIEVGKIGNTTSTFYPDADTESTSVDGGVQRNVANTNWSTERSAASGTAALPSVTFGDDSAYVRYNTFFIGRGIFLFDTSALTGATVSSADLVLVVGGNSQAGNAYSKTCIIGCTPASNTDLVVADYSSYSALNTPTEFATRQAPATAGSAMTFALNASGLAAISTTGISKFMTRCQADVDNTSPGDSITYGAGFYYADRTGTADDPSLVVVHTTPSTPVTVNPSALVATFSLPAETVKTGNTVSPSAQVATFSLPASTISLPKTVAVGVQSATFSIPAVTILAGIVNISASVVTATFSIPTATAKTGTSISVGTQVATFSLPASSVGIGTTMSPAVQTATFSLPVATIKHGSVISAGVQTATFSLPAATITGQTLVSPSVVTATFSIPSITVGLGIVVNAAVQVLTFILPSLARFGGTWTKKGRNASATWSRASRNSSES